LLVRDGHHLSPTDLSRRLQRDLSGLSRSAARLEVRLEKEEALREKVNAIKKTIN